MKLTPDYGGNGCAAIVNGKRCRKRWRCAYPVTWKSDPTGGPAITGPCISLCHRCRARWERGHLGKWSPHARGTNRPGYVGANPLFRMRVTNGWFGAYNEYGYGSAVWSSPTGWKPAPKWWAHRKTLKFGEIRRDSV